MNAGVLLRRVRRRLARAATAAVRLLRMSATARVDRPPVHGSDSGLPAILSNLPPVLDYTGEFGAELILFLPWCNWLSAAGLLRDRPIRTYRGMRCFYDHLACPGILEKEEKRYYVAPRHRPLPRRDEHDFDGVGSSPFLLYPDLRQKFRSLPGQPEWDATDRPLVIIHNKYASEWDGTPVNFIPLETIELLFERLQHRFRVIYIRHGMMPPPPEFSRDETSLLPFADKDLLDRHPGVASFDDLHAAHCAGGGTDDVNLFKNKLYSHAYRFITVQGGGAHHIAMFSGSTMVILHRRGRETEWAYGEGYYNFMANPAPLRLVCKDSAELLAAAAVFDDSEVIGERLHIASRHRDLLRLPGAADIPAPAAAEM